MNRYMSQDMRLAKYSPCTAIGSSLSRAPFVAPLTGINVADAESKRRHRTGTRQQPPAIGFEYVPGPFEITPELAKVLLRILRKAAERRGIDIDDTVSPPS